MIMMPDLNTFIEARQRLLPEGFLEGGVVVPDRALYRRLALALVAADLGDDASSAWAKMVLGQLELRARRFTDVG